MKKLLFLFFSIFIFVGCTSQKSATKINYDDVYDTDQWNQYSYRSENIKSDTTFQIIDDNNKIDYNVYITSSYPNYSLFLNNYNIYYGYTFYYDLGVSWYSPWYNFWYEPYWYNSYWYYGYPYYWYNPYCYHGWNYWHHNTYYGPRKTFNHSSYNNQRSTNRNQQNYNRNQRTTQQNYNRNQRNSVQPKYIKNERIQNYSSPSYRQAKSSREYYNSVERNKPINSNYSTPRSSPSPSYSTPRSSPSPSYSAPRSSPNPSYSAPRSSPNPSYLAPRSSPNSSPSPSRSNPGRR